MTTNQRDKKILNMYKKEKTLREIGGVFGVTRSRIQQIVFNGFKKEIAEKRGLNYRLADGKVSAKIKKSLTAAAHKEIDRISKNRLNSLAKKHREKMRKKIRAKMKSLPHYSKFFTLDGYAAALKMHPGIIRMYFPDIAGELVNKKKKKWSTYFDNCLICGTTTAKHGGHGLCKSCYIKGLKKKKANLLSRQ